MSRLETNPVDIPFYITDNTAVAAATGRCPRLSMSEILDDILSGYGAPRRGGGDIKVRR
jgi:hypothetical protein